MKQIVLASNSPRRKELLGRMDVSFIVKAVETKEYLDEKLPVETAIEAIAVEKAKAVQAFYPESIIIGADTIVWLDGDILGKPKDRQEAVSMLRRLSGRTHKVITGVAIVEKQRIECFHQVSEVCFYPLDETLINEYVETQEPMDKAGAYGIQGKGAFLVEKIVGDYYNIMGLPIAKLYRHLQTHL